MVFKGYVMASEFAGCKGPEKLQPKLHRTGNYYSLEETMKQMAGIGYRGIEVAPFTGGLALDINQDFVPQIRAVSKAKQEHNISVTGLHWILSFLNLVGSKKEGLSIFSSNAKLMETQNYYMAVIRYCADLGGRYVVHGSPGSRERPDSISSTKAFEVVYDFFNTKIETPVGKLSILEYARWKNVKIGFEPLATNETNFVNTVEEGLNLAGCIDHEMFGITIDVKAMAAEGGKSVPKIITSIPQEDREKLVAVHFNDPSLTGPGLGEWKEKKFEDIMGALAEIGWNGYITIEPFKQVNETINEDCEKMIDFLHKCEKNVSG